MFRVAPCVRCACALHFCLQQFLCFLSLDIATVSNIGYSFHIYVYQGASILGGLCTPDVFFCLITLVHFCICLYSRLFFLPDPLCSLKAVSPFLCSIHNVLLFGRCVVGGAHAIAFLISSKKIFIMQS
jgi:hypothetical protein